MRQHASVVCELRLLFEGFRRVTGIVLHWRMSLETSFMDVERQDLRRAYPEVALLRCIGAVAAASSRALFCFATIGGCKYCSVTRTVK